MADPGAFAAALDDTWAALTKVCSDLTDEQWRAPTGCPGWSVQDVVAHICDVEHMLLGDPAPDIPPVDLPHVRNDFGRVMEPGVELRRSWPPSEVLADLETVTARRREALAEIDEAALEQPLDSPLGTMPLRRFLTVRVLDCFSHEQDVRRAVGRPGHAAGPAPDMAELLALRTLAGLLYTGAPELHGRTVGIDIEGQTATLDFTGERGICQMPAESAPWTLTFEVGNFFAWIGGRSDRDDFAWYGFEPADEDLRRAAAAFREFAGFTP